MVFGVLPDKDVLSRALDAVACGVVVWDTETDEIPVLYVNSVFADMLSSKPSDLLGRSATEIFPAIVRVKIFRKKLKSAVTISNLKKWKKQIRSGTGFK